MKPDRTWTAPRGGVRWGVIPLGLALMVAPLIGRSEVLWQIGTRDESSAEFSHWRDRATGERRLNYSDPSQDPVFRIGTSDPARDWFAFQPGTANGAAGYRDHPFTVEFPMDRAPEGPCRLTLHLLAYSPRLPVVQVELNGRRGWYYQRPQLTYTAGDAAAFYLPHYSRSTVQVDLPPTWFQSGTNRLVLTALDQSDERNDGQPSGFTWPGVSGVVYDALELDRLVAPPSAEAEVSVRVEPTVFYVRHEEGLREWVDVVVAMSAWPTNASVRLEVDGRRWEAAAPPGRSHGEARWSFPVPEFPAGTRAEVTVQGAGVERRFPLVLKPARQWTLLLVSSQHLDVGYTDYPSKVAELQSRAVDQGFAMTGEHPEFRFTVDGYWVIEQYLRGRTADRQAQLVRAVREGRLEIPAVYASHFTGFASLENLVRSLYPARRFSRDHSLPFEFALSTDVPSHSWSWASVLNAAGVRYFVAASDAYRAPFLLENRLHERSPFWWEGPDGSRVWTWYSRHYHQGASLFGAPPAIECAAESLPRFLQAYDRAEYRSDAVILYGTQVENVAVDPEQASFAARWNRRFAFPRLEYSGFGQAMDRVTADQTNQAAIVRGDGGPYWEDGLAANARITALARSNMRRAVSAEVLSTVASLAAPGFQPDEVVEARLWENLLLTDEHTWHADISVSDPDSQQSRQQGRLRDSRTLDAAKDVDHLLSRALAAIAERIPNPSRTLVVFNSLSWVRDGWVEVDLPKGFLPVDLVSGEFMAVQMLQTGAAFQRVRFLARGVPSVGYRCYSLRPVPRPPPDPPGESSTTLENEHYRMVLDPPTGSIRSWVDLATGKELVDPSNPYRWNQHLYVTGADALPNRLVQYSSVSPAPELTVHPARGGRLLEVTHHPFGIVARMECTNLHHPRIETTVILHAQEKKVEIINRIEKTQVRSKEAAYFAFPFNMSAPRFRYASQNGFIDPARDLLPGAGREWHCLQDWLALEQDGTAVIWSPVDAPLVTLGDIARGSWPREFGARPGTVFSYIMANYTPEGYQAGQGGDVTFRYVVTTAPSFNAASAHRFGAAALTPLEVNEITRNDKTGVPQGSLSPQQQSFLEVEPEPVSLVTWKRAENGDGTIVRLVETGGESGLCRVHSVLLREGLVERCTAVEDPVADPADRSVSPFRIVTFRAR